MTLTHDEREQFIREAEGKTIKSVSWTSDVESPTGAFYTLHFTDGTAAEIRLLADSY